MKLLVPKASTALIKSHVESGKPFSMVRLGDGEWSIIKWPKTTPEKICKSRIGRWFDTKHLSRKDLVSIRNQIEKACQNADLLGVPSATEMKYPKWSKFVRLCHQYSILRKPKKYFHFYTVKGFNFKAILKNIDMVYCITCRDIGKKIKKEFNLKKVETILIPQERFAYNKSMKRFHTQWKGKRHYPELFHEILMWTRGTDLTGKVVLIGAGGLGKIYCQKIREAGGIALDIGTIFDGWAGYYTRPYLKKPERYKLK